MSGRYSFDSGAGERDPLDQPGSSYSRSRSRPRIPHLPPPSTPNDPFYDDAYRAPSPYHDQDSRQPSPSRVAAHPAAHPDSSFARLRENRLSGGLVGVGVGAGAAEADIAEGARGRMAHSQPYDGQYHGQGPYPHAYQQQSQAWGPPYADPHASPHGYGYDQAYDSSPGYAHGYDQSYQSSPHLAPYGAPTAAGVGSPARSTQSFQSDPFGDPQLAYGQRMDPSYGQFNPNDIDDDGDDGLDYRRSARNSMQSRGGAGAGTAGAAGAAGAAAAGGAAGALMSAERAGGAGGANYDPVAWQTEKSAALAKQTAKQNRNRSIRKWIVIIIVALVIVGGVVGAILGSSVFKPGKPGDSGDSAANDESKNGDLNIDSPEIKALMNNPNLHKVFPGVDYTPINVQYPDCVKSPPSQNNVTRDVAVLSQLTNVIRLYGTDCNQTQMTIHALTQLKLEDTMKIWLGVWQDDDDATNERQLSIMWNILDQYGDKYFKGLIVGNEILFRKQMTVTQLGNLLDSVRTNVTKHGWNLPVATSDLGSNWTPQLAKYSDYLMGNVHPFFGGVPIDEAAGWTYDFWQNQVGTFAYADDDKNVIAEVGWPSQGGTDCPTGDPNCKVGATAGITQMQQLLDTWVCQSLANGSTYFWFEMFDEPWKIEFDTKSEAWEDHWGIMDVDRNLKDGIKIPDCDGNTVPALS